MKLDDVEVGQRVTYTYPGDKPRPGTVTVDRHPMKMVTIKLDDGMDVTTIPALVDLIP